MEQNKSISAFIFKGVLLFLVFWGAHAWFTWGLDFLSFGAQTVLRISIAAAAFIYSIKNGIVLRLNSRLIFGIICYFVAINIPFKSVGEVLAQFILFVPILVLSLIHI